MPFTESKYADPELPDRPTGGWLPTRNAPAPQPKVDPLSHRAGSDWIQRVSKEGTELWVDPRLPPLLVESTEALSDAEWRQLAFLFFCPSGLRVLGAELRDKLRQYMFRSRTQRLRFVWCEPDPPAIEMVKLQIGEREPIDIHESWVAHGTTLGVLQAASSRSLELGDGQLLPLTLEWNPSGSIYKLAEEYRETVCDFACRLISPRIDPTLRTGFLTSPRTAYTQWFTDYGWAEAAPDAAA